jgi:hypothetical protein
MRGGSATALLPIAVAIGGCYNVRLPAPAARAVPDPIPVAATVVVPPATSQFTYDVRSGLAGGANTWTVHVGDAVAKYADAYLRPAFLAGDDVTIQVELRDFDVRDMGAKPVMHFTVHDAGGVSLFDQTYECDAPGHFAQVFWGGAFAMKSALRKTTDRALRSCFDRFVAAARIEYPSWSLDAAPPPRAGPEPSCMRRSTPFGCGGRGRP